MEKLEGSWSWGGCLESGTGAGMLSITSGAAQAGAAAAGVGAGVVVLGAFAIGCVIGGLK